MADLTNKVAIITGSASGIGAETVRLFLEAGAKVVAVDRQAPPVAPALLERFPRHLRSVQGDVADEAAAKAYSHEALTSFGRIDILINNAGMAVIKPLHEHTPEEWDRVMNVNVKSIYWGARHVIPVMKRQGC